MAYSIVEGTRLIFVLDDPGIPSGLIDDPFAGLTASQIVEGKAIGSALLKANVGSRDAELRGMAPTRVQDSITRAARNSTRALQPIYDDHRLRLMGVVRALIDGEVTRAEARIRSAKLIRESYERVREVARRASGLEQLGVDRTIYTEEEKWFRSAVREEVSYFHAFLEDVRNNRAHNITERVGAYVKALRFMYESARIQAMPDRVLLYWRGPRKSEDPKVCEGCEYMMERSPFPKDLIPCVPRDGMTPCLTNCRHRIFVRVVRDLNDVVRRRHALGKRESMLRELNERKREASLGRAVPKTTGVARNPFKNDPLTRHVSRPIKGRRR
jgi:hypothetical protein